MSTCSRCGYYFKTLEDEFIRNCPKCGVEPGENKDITFELYCVEVENIPYYNFLSDEEYEEVYEQYEKYIGVEESCI